MNNKQQTAVEWLVDNLHYLHSTKWDDIVEQAKAMEKEQRMEAWCSGYDSYDEDISGDSPLEYYNKTFNTKER